MQMVPIDATLRDGTAPVATVTGPAGLRGSG